MDDYVRVIVHLIEAGANNQEWPADPSPYETASIFTGALNQLVITKSLYGVPRNLSKAAEHAVARLMPLLQAP
ncbi:MAG: hypothetical protein HKO62_13075 [Gammaproteobacteria bacterium]|nr:hypothetical protein [Gammaproteobacteria bacterium]